VRQFTVLQLNSTYPVGTRSTGRSHDMQWNFWINCL